MCKYIYHAYPFHHCLVFDCYTLHFGYIRNYAVMLPLSDHLYDSVRAINYNYLKLYYTLYEAI